MVGDTIPFHSGVARLVGELIEEVAKLLKVKSEMLQFFQNPKNTKNCESVAARIIG